MSEAKKSQFSLSHTIIIVVITLVIVALLGTGGYFIYTRLNPSPTQTVTRPPNPLLVVDPTIPLSQQWTPEEQLDVAKQTITMFNRFRDDRQMYPVSISCTDDENCQLGLANHRDGLTMLWSMAKNYQRTGKTDFLAGLVDQINAYSLLIASRDYMFQNNYYTCNLINQIRQIPELQGKISSNHLNTLQTICFDSVNEYYLDQNNEIYDPTPDESAQVIQEKITSLMANDPTLYDWNNDAAIQILGQQPILIQLAENYFIFVADEVDKYAWQTEAGTSNYAIFSPNSIYPEGIHNADWEAIRNYNWALSLYYLSKNDYESPENVAQLATVLLATEKLTQIYDLAELNNFASYVRNILNTNLASLDLNTLDQVAIGSLGYINSQLTVTDATLSARIAEAAVNKYYVLPNLAGFREGIDDNYTDTFEVKWNGLLTGVIAH